MPRLLVATGNAGKLREYREIFAGLPLELVSPRDLGLDLEVEENGDTFSTNAEIKARAYAQAAGIPTLADDSGLEVDAIGGLPGVHSARYAGDGASDADRRHKLLEALASVPDHRRSARFRCVIALYWDGSVHFTEGAIEGDIGREERGSGGFGYDSLFQVPGAGKTMAELSAVEKNAISHRGQAARAARAVLERLLQETSSNPSSGASEPRIAHVDHA